MFSSPETPEYPPIWVILETSILLDDGVLGLERYRAREHIHLEACVVSASPVLEGDCTSDSMDSVTPLKDLLLTSPGNRLMGVVPQPPSYTCQVMVHGHGLVASSSGRARGFPYTNR